VTADVALVLAVNVSGTGKLPKKELEQARARIMNRRVRIAGLLAGME
jgi:hypothetical protein